MPELRKRRCCSEHQVEFSRHLAKLGKRTSIHFTHRPAAVDLYCCLGDADFVGNPLARPPPCDLNHNLKLSGAQGCKPPPEVSQPPLSLATVSVTPQAALDSVKKFLIPYRLGEELDCAT